MVVTHKNKTLAALLAFIFGGLGIHRFYMYGMKDAWGWVHLCTLLISGVALFTIPGQPLMFIASPLVISILAGFIETFIIGLMPDDKWDARHNPGSDRQSHSGWLVAIILVLTVGVGATSLIAAIARTFDLLYTGGAYG
jgi:TM2 domain-containing membrane protein YozV